MALIGCPHCGHTVSDKAEKCPACGKDPRYTEEQLQAREKTAAEKRKRSSVIVGLAATLLAIVLLLIFIPRILEHSRLQTAYNSAQKLFVEKNYEDAIKAFSELGDFEDSAQKVQVAMYEYVLQNKDRQNPTTRKYIKCLREQNHPKINALAREIFQWKGTAYVTDKESGSAITHSFGANDPLFFKISVSGGEPNESIKIGYKMVLYTSSADKKRGYDNKTEVGYLDTRFYDGTSGWIGYTRGIGTTRYIRIKTTFFDIDTGEDLCFATAIIHK